MSSTGAKSIHALFDDLRETARGLAERIPATNTEVTAAAAEPRETPPMDPAEWARLKAEQTAQYETGRQARIQAAARACPSCCSGRIEGAVVHTHTSRMSTTPAASAVSMMRAAKRP